MSSVASLLENIRYLSPKLEQDDSMKSRNKAIQLSSHITAALSRPEDGAAEMIFLVTKISIEMNLLDLIVNHGGAVTSDKVAEKYGAEELLITRILRVLASVSLLANVDDRTWQATPVTGAMAVEGVAAGYQMM
ncbi:hypothetical protein E0Z10_g6377 [Xylaria hypoxylon]|uniref:O-methyltransferase dimerisation domain-containing protein n=1 Tax=Xylaria hypoxylon TaxID=37992 RepID=A0A4Z0YQW9_9PEZI|nr:hypothetical protein E0Z10_g6377 [Xylaria hypoxylon]